MKKSIVILAGLGVAALAVMVVATRRTAPAETVTTPKIADTVAVETPSRTVVVKTAKAEVVATNQKSTTTNALIPGSAEAIAFAAAIDTLASAHATWAEKQAAWKELLASGRIQDAIAELEQRAANDPQNAQIAATLGEAYLKACGTTQDVRSQAIWAMTADKDFDAALSIDPQNWDARFTKAVAMTYWPENLNKGQETVDQFNTLIQQQEKEAPQPQFAQTYDWLGQEYTKLGQPDLAQQTWQRGATLFPDNQALQTRLAAPPTGQQ